MQPEISVLAFMAGPRRFVPQRGNVRNQQRQTVAPPWVLAKALEPGNVFDESMTQHIISTLLAMDELVAPTIFPSAGPGMEFELNRGSARGR
ncbi:hypothetical protein ACIPUB_07130 [Paeniglutamicibacter sp. ORCA_105]|uniref:hypothetical protein n=1 Tax=Paeniglutamicibacter sp. ORCA_105 TaxID=3377336 RepID=UPI0038964F11